MQQERATYSSACLGGKQLSLKAVSGVCIIYKSGAHMENRAQETRTVRRGAKLTYSNTSLRAELCIQERRKTESVHQNTPIPLDFHIGSLAALLRPAEKFENHHSRDL